MVELSIKRNTARRCPSRKLVVNLPDYLINLYKEA